MGMYENDATRLPISGGAAYFDELSRVQAEALDYVDRSGSAARVINVSSTGTGKTRMTRGYIDRYRGKLKNPHMTVLCPKITRAQWAQELSKSGYDCRIVPDSKHMSEAWEGDVSILTPQLAAYRFKHDRSFRDEFQQASGLVVYDEVHSATTRTLNKKVLDSLKFSEGLYVLSATPEWNAPRNLYAMAHTVFPFVQLPSWSDFSKRYCDIEYVVRRWVPADGSRYETFSSASTGAKLVRMPTVGGWLHDDSMYEFLRTLPCVVRVNNRLLPVRRHRVPVPLSADQQRMYDTMTTGDDAYFSARGGDYAVDYTITQRIRLAQICLATPMKVGVHGVEFDDEGESPKIDVISDMQRSFHRRALVWTTSAQFAVMLESRMSGRCRRYTGDMSKRERERAMQWFRETPDAFMVIVCAAGGVGLDGLQKVCNVQIWANRSEPLGGAQEIQCNGRLNRTGTAFKYIDDIELVAQGTFEERR